MEIAIRPTNTLILLEDEYFRFFLIAHVRFVINTAMRDILHDSSRYSLCLPKTSWYVFIAKNIKLFEVSHDVVILAHSLFHCSFMRYCAIILVIFVGSNVISTQSFEWNYYYESHAIHHLDSPAHGVQFLVIHLPRKSGIISHTKSTEFFRWFVNIFLFDFKSIFIYGIVFFFSIVKNRCI